jgi:hypothetical protein
VRQHCIAAPNDWPFSREEAKAAKRAQRMQHGDHPAFAARAILLDMAAIFMLCSSHEIEILPTLDSPNIEHPVVPARAFAGWFFPGVIVYFV